jgi:ATP-dependent DNA helicase RecG
MNQVCAVVKILLSTNKMLTKKDIQQIIAKGEGLHIEFKRSQNNVPNDMYETIVSFSNCEGGIILLGVDDEGTLIGIDNVQQNKMLKNLVSALASPDHMSPPLYLQPQAIEVDDKSVIAVQVPVSSQVHKLAGKIFVREYESDIDISNDQQRVSDLYHTKRTTFSENEIIDNITLDDLDQKVILKARNLIRSNKGDHPWLSMDDLSLLKEAILWRKDFRTGKEGLTLAAALIFGKETAIQSLLPAYKVEAILRRNNLDRWDDRLSLRKNLIDTYIDLKTFVNRYLPERFYMEGYQRVDLRDKIFREVIGNIIVHREYNAALSTEFIIEKFRVVAINPNKPHFNGPINLDSFNPYPKNPNIRKFFTHLGWADEIGSGIRNTKKYLPLYGSESKPVFIEGDVFTTIIPLQVANLKIFTDQWLSWLELNNEYAEHLGDSLEKLHVSPEIAEMTWKQLLLLLVPGWNEKGTQLYQMGWPVNQIVDEYEILMVPGWLEKGTQLIHKKVRYYIAILMLTAKPLSLDNIMKAIGYANKKTFRNNYIKPLLELKFIVKTEIGSSPDQKYKLTSAGRLFLTN